MASNYFLGVNSDWTDVLNWSLGAAPVSTNDVYIVNSSQNIDTHLTQSAVTLNSLTIDASYTGQIGTTSAYLNINSTTVNIGKQTGGANSFGSGRIRLNGTYTTANIFDTAVAAADTGFPPVLFGAGTITTLNLKSGSIGLAILTPIETCTVTTLNVTQADVASSQPKVLLGFGVSHTTINQEAGLIANRTANALTTLNLLGGQYRAEGTGAITTANIFGGTLINNSTGTITTCNIYAAQLDCSNDPRAKTITNCTAYAGANINLQTGVKGSVTLTNGIILSGIDLNAMKLLVGTGRTLTLS